MKAEELMISDWVRQKHSGLKLQVSEIRPPYILAECEEGQFREDTIEPIPLTLEILEKNGYSYNEIRDAWETIQNKFFGICKDEDDNCFYFCIRTFDDFDDYMTIANVNCVHELQHALKLCGIEKEIVL